MVINGNGNDMQRNEGFNNSDTFTVTESIAAVIRRRDCRRSI
jgi:hypothetical protein